MCLDKRKSGWEEHLAPADRGTHSPTQPLIGGSLCRVPNPLRYIGACSVRPGAVRSITVSMPLTAASRLLLTARKVSPC